MKYLVFKKKTKQNETSACVKLTATVTDFKGDSSLIL